MIVLGCDPGARTGLVILDGRIFRDRLDVTADELRDAVCRLCATWDPRILAIELPSQVFAFGRGSTNMAARVGIEKALLAARGIAGTVRGIVETLCPGVKVYEAQAHEVRKAVLGRIPRAPKGTDSRVWIDGIVRQRVPLLVTGWDRGAGDNDHNRDAAVAALWGQARARMPEMRAPKRRKRAA